MMHSLLGFCAFALLLASTLGSNNAQTAHDTFGAIDIDGPTAAELGGSQPEPPDFRQQDHGHEDFGGPHDWGLAGSGERNRLPVPDLVRLLLTAYSKHPRESGRIGPPPQSLSPWQRQEQNGLVKSKRYMGMAVADFVQPKNGGLEDDEGLGERGGEGRSGQPRRKVRLLGSG